MSGPPTALELLDRRASLPARAALLWFGGVADQDVYNLTAPFRGGDQTLIAARVERRESEQSHVRFFTEEEEGRWIATGTGEGPRLQDPFTFVAGARRYLGGVKVATESSSGSITGWSTVVLEGVVPDDLRFYLEGPPGMKDIRFVDLGDRVGVFTRPQGDVGGRGTIGFTTAPDIGSVTPALLQAAPLLDGQFAPGEWGGANEVHLLEDGTLGVLGHVAYFDEQGHRHYYAMAFTFDATTRVRSPLQIVATRSDFPPAAAKRPDLVDVIFPGGLDRHPDGTATLYAGLSDTRAGTAEIADPFLTVG